MAKPNDFRQGQPLLQENNRVRFGLYNAIIPGQRVLRISDVWRYLEYYVKSTSSLKQPELILSYLAQAEDFDNATEGAPERSRPLLHYYSFLNLAKALLATAYSKEELDSALTCPPKSGPMLY